MTLDKEHEGTFCVLDSGEFQFHIGIVGTGPGFLTILDIARDGASQEYLPPMRLCGVAKAGMSESPKLEAARGMGIPIHATVEELLEAHPEINLVIELTSSLPMVRLLRTRLPSAVSLVDHAAAVFLCGLHNMLQIARHQQFTLKSQRALLQVIIDEVRDDILLLDKNRCVVDLNQVVAERTGKTKEELIGKPCHDVQVLDAGSPFCDSCAGDCPFDVTLRTRANAEALVSRVDDAGRLRYFRIYSYPVLNKRGDLTHILVMRRDITERTQREKNLHQTEKLAVIGEMSTYLAHEIRNPLFAIGGFVNSLLRSKNLDESERDKVRIIAEETKRLDVLLKSILTFVKPETRQMGGTDLNRAARDTVELMRIGYGGQGYSLGLREAPGVPHVRGEPELIKQCLINLVKNAVEAMSGGGVIEVETGFDSGAPYVRVRDNGPGIPASEMDKLFSPFYSTKDQGYGLGLAMIKKIVEEAGGRVELSSIVGEGTTVTLFFEPELALGVNNGGEKEILSV